MEISEVRVKLMGERSDRLKAFCSITVDREFVIRDLKIIEGTNGMFIAMPSRKITDKCPTCGIKNHVRAKYCNECGGRLDHDRAGRDPQGRVKLHADIAHPINAGCRDRMQRRIVRSYEEELRRSTQPGYQPRFEEEFDDVGFVEQQAVDNVAGEASPRQDPGRSQARDAGKQARDDTFGAGIL